MEKRSGIVTDKERKRIDKQLEKKKEVQMGRIKDAYDKTYKVVDDTERKNNIREI